MKKFFLVLLIGFCAIANVNAEVEFSYEAGAELVSSYLWRGQYNGGLSFQPSLAVGYEGEHTSFSFGVWGSVGASDWGFRKETEILGIGMGDGTYFVPELDFTATFSFFNVTVGLTHYYYCDGGKFFGWKNKWSYDELPEFYETTTPDWTTSSTEVQIGYNFADLLPEEHNLYVNWYTMVAGCDYKSWNFAERVVEAKQNFSSYIELGYDYTFDDLGLTLGAQVGLVPWSSAFIYGNDGFAVQNLSLRVGKTWELGDLCELELFGQGMINPSGLASDNESAFVKASGDYKIGCQTLNGTIGLGVWF